MSSRSDEAQAVIGAWKLDLKRYGKHPFTRELSIYAVAVMRFGQWVDTHVGLKSKLLGRVYWSLYRLSEIATGISLPKDAVVGGGLRIFHFGGVMIHPAVRIGSNVTLRHGVTIGERTVGGEVPTIGDNVEVGANAFILGGITVGNNAKIGALALVISDVPESGVVVAAAAEEIKR